MPGGIPVPGWLSGVFSWGHKVTKEMEGEAEPAPVDDSLGYEPPAPVEPEPAPAQPAPAFEPVKVTSNHPRAAFDIDLGPDTSVSEGGSEPIEPIIIGPAAPLGRTRSKRPRPGPSSNRWCRMPWRLPPRISSRPPDRLLRPRW